VRGIWVVGETLFAVVAQTLYEIDVNWVATSIGNLATSSGRVQMTDNGTQLLIVDGSFGYVCTIATSTLAQITDPDFPAANTCAYMDGYGIVDVPGTGRFMITSLNDFTSVDALDFSSADGAPDNTVAVFVDHRELILFGDRTFEVFYNSGNADFPFERVQGAVGEIGCCAPHSPARMNNSVYWLGGGKEGWGIVFKMNQYTPERVSDHSVETAISRYTTVSDAFGYCYQYDGHSFYVLTFPTENATWVLDAATGKWHERGWWRESTAEFIRHRSNCYAFFNGHHVVGDFENGKIYTLDPDTYTDDGDPLIALVRDKHIYKDMKRLRHRSLQLDMETGVGLSSGQGSDPQVMLRFSDDGGRTWSNEITQTMGAIGAYLTRVIFQRLGISRDRIYELRISDPVKRAIVGASLDIEELAN
jgi:hypothetical protein